MNSGRGKKIGDCERSEEAARARKRCAFEDSVPYVPGLTTVSVKKRTKKTTCFLSDPPSPVDLFSSRDDLLINPIFELLSSRAIQNIP